MVFLSALGGLLAVLHRAPVLSCHVSADDYGQRDRESLPTWMMERTQMSPMGSSLKRKLDFM